MPTYTCGELLAMGDYLVKQKRVPEKVLEAYKPSEFKKRYLLFGGIYNYVLPKDLDWHEEQEKTRVKRIAHRDVKKIFSTLNTIVDEKVSEFLMAMNVKRSGEGRFRKYDAEYTTLDF